MRACPYTIHQLLPHGPSMVLLDAVQKWDQGFVQCTLSIRPGISFYIEGEGVPSYVGLEYMAQTCGAYAGLEGLAASQPVRLGFLLGTRNFHASIDWFTAGDALTITGTEVMRQDYMGVFDCRISINDNEIASAQLSLYRPDNVADILRPPEG